MNTVIHYQVPEVAEIQKRLKDEWRSELLNNILRKKELAPSVRIHARLKSIAENLKEEFEKAGFTAEISQSSEKTLILQVRVP